jgi:hypothetical protein
MAAQRYDSVIQFCCRPVQEEHCSCRSSMRARGCVLCCCGRACADHYHANQAKLDIRNDNLDANCLKGSLGVAGQRQEIETEGSSALIGARAACIWWTSYDVGHGEVFLVGAAWKRGTAVVAADVVRPVFRKYLALRSGWEWQVPLYGDKPLGSIAGCTDWILSCMRDGSLYIEELITDRVSPAEVPAAYADLWEHPAEHMGVVIDWQRM